MEFTVNAQYEEVKNNRKWMINGKLLFSTANIREITKEIIYIMDKHRQNNIILDVIITDENYNNIKALRYFIKDSGKLGRLFWDNWLKNADDLDELTSDMIFADLEKVLHEYNKYYEQ